VKLTEEDVSAILAASANVHTAAIQIDNAAHGRPELEELAAEMSRWASVIEIVAVTLRDE
jgi:hypothetical protein